MEIPLLNTFTLITSGFYIALSHLYFLNNFFSKSIKALFSTILIGLYFSIIQIFEYKNAYFCINDRIYASERVRIKTPLCIHARIFSKHRQGRKY